MENKQTAKAIFNDIVKIKIRLVWTFMYDGIAQTRIYTPAGINDMECGLFNEEEEYMAFHEELQDELPHDRWIGFMMAARVVGGCMNIKRIEGELMILEDGIDFNVEEIEFR